MNHELSLFLEVRYSCDEWIISNLSACWALRKITKLDGKDVSVIRKINENEFFIAGR